MATIERDGVEIYYEAQGSGPAVLLSHGYGATSQMWAGQLPALATEWRVIAWDMRGHGRSGSPEDASLYSEAETVADMAAILDAEGAEEAVIGGLSLGGYMSLAFQLEHPERTRALMLFDTGPGYNNPKGREGWNQNFAFPRAEALEQRGLEALGGSEEVRVSTHRSAAGLARAARGMLAQFDNRVISVAGGDYEADAGAGGGERRAVSGLDRLLSQQDRGLDEGGDRQRGARGEHR